MRLFVLVLGLVASGCGSRVYPCDRPVAVDVSALVGVRVPVELADGSHELEDLSTYVAEGVRMWDTFGATLRVETAPGAPVLRYVADYGDPDGHWGSYMPEDGAVHVYMKNFDGSVYWPPYIYRALMAHEAGHAMGLQHVPCEEAHAAVMATACDPPDRVTAEDEVEFERAASR